MSMFRWRQIEDGFQYERQDPHYQGNPHHGTVDGWRPMANVWKYTYGPGDVIPPPTIGEMSRFGFKPPKASESPWRILIESEGFAASRPDHVSLESAKLEVEHILGGPDASPA